MCAPMHILISLATLKKKYNLSGDVAIHYDSIYLATLQYTLHYNTIHERLRPNRGRGSVDSPRFVSVGLPLGQEWAGVRVFRVVALLRKGWQMGRLAIIWHKDPYMVDRARGC